MSLLNQRPLNPMIFLICEQCKEEFPRYKYRITAAIKRGSKHIWCSSKCQGYWLKRNYI